MPKIVDVHERRSELAAALWRVATRDGVAGVSVRSVAAEAGLSAGSLRHYFPSQAELVAFSLEAVAERITARIARVPAGDDPVREAKAVLAELMPLDADRRSEVEVWFAFLAHARSNPRLQSLSDQIYDRLHRRIRQSIGELSAAGRLRPGLDPAVETQRLYALLDGLLLHWVLRPQRVSAAMTARILRRHLDDICVEAG